MGIKRYSTKWNKSDDNYDNKAKRLTFFIITVYMYISYIEPFTTQILQQNFSLSLKSAMHSKTISPRFSNLSGEPVFAEVKENDFV